MPKSIKVFLSISYNGTGFHPKVIIRIMISFVHSQIEYGTGLKTTVRNLRMI